MTDVSPRPNGRKKAPERPPQIPTEPPAEVPDLLEVLGLSGLKTWTEGNLEELSTAELFGLICATSLAVGPEPDPVLAVLRNLSDELNALELAVAQPTLLEEETMQALLTRHRYTALVAGELHRRVLAAARSR